MAKRKNMKADKPRYVGTVTFDGNIQVNLHGEVKTLRTDIGGLGLQKANPNKELLVLTRDHVGYNEIDTGYIVRSKRYDDGQPPYFGLKHEPDADGWGCHNYCDVIAWGYADGGLNDPTLFYSCQSTVEEEIEREKWRAEHGMKTHAEKLAEIFRHNNIRSITVTRMTVPCCGGLPFAVKTALQESGKDIPLHVITISPNGAIMR